MTMPIAAISASPVASATAQRDTVAVPARQLQEAFASSTTPEPVRRLVMDSLLTLGSVTVRVVEQRASGESIIEVDGARIALRLPGVHAPSDSVQLALTEPDGEWRVVPKSDYAFSNTARLLASLAAPPQEAVRPATDTRPLAESGDTPDFLAGALSKAVSGSGLFYEAHLARWLEGDYLLADVRREPQSEVTLTGANDLGPGGIRAEQPAVVAERLLPLLRQQLGTLENQTIPWSGMLWPGQSGSIEIHPEDSRAIEAGTRDPVWITRLTLDLPRLGRVEALVALRGAKVALSLVSDTADTASELTIARASLEQALASRGLHADSLLVKHAGA